MSTKELLLCMLLPLGVLGQKEDYNWCFMDSSGVNFSDLAPIPFISSAWLDPIFPAGTECNATISNTSGILLFYSNGTEVWNRNNELMQNGTGMFTNNSVTQGALILPMINDSLHYYIFNIYPDPVEHGLYYSIVNMELDNGLGDVEIVKKNILVDSTDVGEKLMAVKHANGRDWWIIHSIRNTNKYSVCLMSPDTIVITSIQQIGASGNHADYGELNFSPDGSKAIASREDGLLNLFDFDRCTGVFSNFVDLSDATELIYYGTSFSPDGSKVYCSSFINLYQFDLTAPNIFQSRQLIWHNPYYNENDILNSYFLCQHQLAPDGKIYLTLARTDYSTYVDTFIDKSLCVINKPNELGAACDFVPDAFYLGGQHSGFGLPNSPNYNLGRLVGSPCDTLFNGISNIAPPKNEVNVFPNPASDKITIKLGQQILSATLEMFDVNGRKVFREKLSAQKEISVDVSFLPEGIYLCRISSEKNIYLQKKLIIVR